MTTRYKALLVTLTEDIREDDAEAVINAIELLRCVAGVKGVDALPSSDSIAEGRNMLAVCDDLQAMMRRWMSEGPGKKKA